MATRVLVGEFGLVIPQGIASITKQVPRILEDAENGLPDTLRALIARLTTHLKDLDCQVDELEAQIQVWHRQNAESRRLAEIPGIGPITATALVASIGDAKTFANSRQLAGLARTCAKAAFERRQAYASWYQQARGRVPSDTPHSRRASRDPRVRREAHARDVAKAPPRSPPEKRGGGGARQQERAHGMGTLGPWAGLSSERQAFAPCSLGTP